MLSTMQDVPLSLTRILEYGSTVHGDTLITTWGGADGIEQAQQTFSAVGARAAALTHALHDSLGITGDQRVASMLYNCAEHMETMFAVACMGAVFNPLNKQLMNDQIVFILNHSEAEVVIADPRMAEQLGEILKETPKVRVVVFIGPNDFSSAAAHMPEGMKLYSYEALLDGRSTVYNWPEQDERTAAAICYSTGTSGPPKGVVYSHRSLYLQSLSLRTTDSLAVEHGETFLCCVPIYHVLSWGVPIAAFMSGTPLVLPGPDLSAPTLAKIISTTLPRVAHGVPTLWIQLMVHYLKNPPERMSLRELYVGGSAVPPIVITMWEQRYGVDVVHVWGMTETSTVGTVSRPPSGVSGETRWNYRVSQGRFPASLQYRIVNDGQVMASTDRNEGEIQVRGPWVTASYFHPDVEKEGGTASTFRDHDVEEENDELFTADGWLRTGDVGSVTSDGFLTIQDRARDVIRSGGEWIYSAQLENLIVATEEVVECAVIGFPDDKWVERPLAVTMLYPGIERTRETAERLRDQLRDRLPNWMLPEYWTFVDEVDKTSVGKYDKKDLRNHLRNGEFEVIKLKGPGEK
ncbi:long-chain fatty-acid--CoA ligase [Corynebacterium glutamicum]|uniref:long-chain fatty-acid--CoA ligase n=1 Tax=Corynebacterium glutamicum TaxID=1718 RepID=UPI000589E223|nr:long-chain fatty-acid--CoA ligase [Corynebacterium glutamicum]KIH73845.1 long-chain fatty acid--CoA ligase [Corynebacterium glutamicum]